MGENAVLFAFSVSERSDWELHEQCGGRLFLQAPLKCVIHVSGSQMSLHTRLHSECAIIYANSAAPQAKTEAPGSLLVITQ